ncbi:App1 family protein [Aestuariimicrobium soli]|uniref:App1 family protein n=1 Tax=Aestuariimicrobium soli TaxID=2035834 RepID=UPI003EBB7950
MSNRPFIGARAEEVVNRQLAARMRKRGWVETIIPYAGYGSSDQLRILGRVVLTPANPRTDLLRAADKFLSQRGWRNFMAVPIAQASVAVTSMDSTIEIEANRGGYIDVRIKNPGLGAGLHHVDLRTPDSKVVRAPVHVVGDDMTFGLISDIDDTVISTWLPRLFIAAWNSFVVTEQAREPVPGMARLYQQLLREHPGAPIIYVSTGAWNTYPFLQRFLKRHGLPAGPMLLTDWGPTNTGWFRSGPDHKRIALRELARDLPQVEWLLFGDDGQHDPFLYNEFAALQPEHVRGIAIRQLTQAQQVLAHGTATVLQDRDHLQWEPDAAPEVRGADGDELRPKVLDLLAED